MPPNYRRNQIKQRKAKKGHGWTKLERIEMDCIWIHVNFKKMLAHLFSNLYQLITQLKNHSQLLCGRDFANQKTLALPI